MATSDKMKFNYLNAFEINDVHTDVVFHKFANKYLLIITQYEKINNVFVVNNEIAFNGVIRNQCLNIKHQFGKTTDEIECSIRFLINKMNINTDREFVVCLGLKEYNRDVLKAIEKALASIDTI